MIVILVLLSVIAVGALAFGALVFSEARTAVHEIEALIMFLIGTVALGCAGIIEAVRRNVFRWPFPPPPVQVTEPPPEHQFKYPQRPPKPGE